MPQDATSHLEPPPDHVPSPLVPNARRLRPTRAAPPPQAAAGVDDNVVSPVVSRARKPLATRAPPPPEPAAAVAEHWQDRARRCAESGADQHMPWCPVHEKRLDLTRRDTNNEVSAHVFIASGYTPQPSPRGQGDSPTHSPRHAHIGTRVLAGSAVSDTAGVLGSPRPSHAAAQLQLEGLAAQSPSGGPVSIHARIAVACSPRCTWA